MRLAFFQMRLAVGGDSPCFSKCASRILEKVRRILISVPDTGYNLFASSAISASSADEESNSAFFGGNIFRGKVELILQFGIGGSKFDGV